MADRRVAGKNANEVPPREVPPAVAEVVAMLASIEAATARVEEKLDKVLAELATVPRPAGQPVRGPVALHALRNRLSCRGHRRPLHPAQQCAHYRRDH